MKRAVMLFLLCVFVLLGLSAAGALAAVTQDPAELENFFFRDYRFRRVALDPDVLVLSPVASQDIMISKLTDDVKKEAKHLADRLGGKFRICYDADATEQLLTGDLTKWGTVIVVTHGGFMERKGDLNSGLVGLLLYKSFDERASKDKWNELVRSGRFDPEECVDYRESKMLDHDAPQLIFVKGRSSTEVFDINFESPIEHWEIQITTNWLLSRYANADFPNTGFMFVACGSFNDAVFRRFLEDRGAAYFVSYTKSAGIFSITKADDLLRKLSTTDQGYQERYSARYNTIKGARDSIEDPILAISGDKDFTYAGYGRVRGKVLDSRTNEGLPGVRVHAWRYWNGKLQEEDTVETVLDGRYEFEGLAWGLYLLQAEDGAYEGFLNFSFAEDISASAMIEILRTEEGDMPAGGEEIPQKDVYRECPPGTLDGYLGTWKLLDNERCGLHLTKAPDGRYVLCAYFDTPYGDEYLEAYCAGVDQDGFVVFNREFEYFEDEMRLYLDDGWMSLTVQPGLDYLQEVFEERGLEYLCADRQTLGPSTSSALEGTAWMVPDAEYPEYSPVLYFHDGFLRVYVVGNAYAVAVPYAFDGSALEAGGDPLFWGTVSQGEMELHCWDAPNGRLERVEPSQAALFLEQNGYTLKSAG